MRILFISRTYPPIIGGIEKQNHDIAKSLAAIADVKIHANTKRGLLLPFFTIYAFFYALSHLKNFNVVLLGDGALSILAYFLKFFTAKPVVSIVHGLDITYSNALYQNLWIKNFIKKPDRLIAVGNETIKQGVNRGIPAEKFVFVPNGVFIKKDLPDYTRGDLEKSLGINVEGPILLTLGRMVRRKGVAWFVENVVQYLADIQYIIAGDGPERNREFDTPTLIEVWRTEPYLYDGRAKSMFEVIKKYNANDEHGIVSQLSYTEVADLIEFVLSL